MHNFYPPTPHPLEAAGFLVFESPQTLHRETFCYHMLPRLQRYGDPAAAYAIFKKVVEGRMQRIALLIVEGNEKHQPAKRVAEAFQIYMDRQREPWRHFPEDDFRVSVLRADSESAAQELEAWMVYYFMEEFTLEFAVLMQHGEAWAYDNAPHNLMLDELPLVAIVHPIEGDSATRQPLATRNKKR